MMHAKIPESLEPSRAPSNDRLAECVKHLSLIDRDFYRRRAVQEDDAAAKASCCEARRAHEELAAAYRQLCRPNGARVDPHLSSDLAMFRFNPKPADQY